MSTERLPFGFNSLIPETYKSKAEAFAKCLQHKLLSLGRLDTSSESCGAESRKRLSDDQQQESSSSFNSSPEFPKPPQLSEGIRASAETCQKTKKTEDSDEDFCSHSESENSDLSEQRKPNEKEMSIIKQKLTSMSSEDSTVESWSSCQENLTDFEKFDSESEDVNYFALQIKGSPKLRTYNIRCKRKETREKPWKRNSRKNHSSSTESVDSEGRGGKQMANHQLDNFDSDSHSDYILLDGLEDEEVPHRILRESSSTSNLERHFSGSFEEEFDMVKKSQPKVETKEKLDSELNTDSNSDLQINEKEKGAPNHTTVEKTETNPEDLTNRLSFAEVATDFEEIQYSEVESMKDFSTDDVSRIVKKLGGVVIECCDDNPRTDVQVPQEETWVSENFILSSVEVLQDDGELDEPDDDGTKKEEIKVTVEDQKKSECEPAANGEDDEMLDSRSKLRRCSSLKTWKTPPGTPGAKKIVRFADALGLDLADVRTFLDEIPKIPSSAYEDLHFDLPSNTDPLPPLAPTPTLMPLFQQPGSKMDFLEKVQQQKICLENALVTDTGVLTVTGYARVQNMSYNKSVHVRYSLNNWETFSDLQATYVPNSCDGFSDKFTFVLYGHTLKVGDKLEFALRLDCCGTQYWDNNGGFNYVFSCLPQTSANNFFSSICSNQNDPWFNFY